MANERLRSAMALAHVDLDSIVEATGVDPKTAPTLDQFGRTPHARNRSRLVKLVGREETYLWPMLQTASGPVWQADPSLLVSIRTAPMFRPICGQLVLPSRPDRASTFSSTQGCSYMSRIPRFQMMSCAETATGGCNVRVALGDPEGICIKVRGTDEQFGHGMASRCQDGARCTTGH